MNEDKKIMSLFDTRKKEVSLTTIFREIIENGFTKAMENSGLFEILKAKSDIDIQFPENQKVEITNPKEIQKVEGEVQVKFPSVQKIIGEVIAKVTFPLVQKVEGTVKALIDFPKVQKIEGEVQVKFPDTQKVEGTVKTDIPRIKTEKLDVVPIAFFDGKRLLSPEVFTQSIQGNGKLFTAIKELESAVATQSVFYTGQVKLTASGITKSLGSSKNIKTLVVQALKDNRGTLYITNNTDNDFELQSGQSLTIVIDDLSKVKIVGSYINDGVCYAAS